MKTEDRPTAKSVELYVRRLQSEAQRKIASDPYAQPYAPMWDEEHFEANVRKLIQRATNEALASAREPGDITDEAYAFIVASGPALAIEELRKRAAMAEGRARRQALAASESLSRLAGLHARECRKRDDRRASLSPGRRIDQALASLSSVSMVSASVLGGDQVKGGERDRSPKWSGDQFGAARAECVRLAVKLEQLVDECKVRDLGRAA